MGAQLGLKPKWCSSQGCLVPWQTSGKIWDKHNQGLQGPSGAGKVSFPFSPRRQWGSWGARSRLMVSAQLWAAGVVQSSCTAPAHPHWPSSQLRRGRLGGKGSEFNILKMQMWLELAMQPGGESKLSVPHLLTFLHLLHLKQNFDNDKTEGAVVCLY